MTRITVPGAKSAGWQDWGVHDAPDMISQIRLFAAHLRMQAEEIEACDDADFQIDVVRGPAVQHFVRTVQQSARKPAARTYAIVAAVLGGDHG